MDSTASEASQKQRGGGEYLNGRADKANFLCIHYSFLKIPISERAPSRTHLRGHRTHFPNQRTDLNHSQSRYKKKKKKRASLKRLIMMARLWRFQKRPNQRRRRSNGRGRATHRYLEDLLQVVKHLNPYGDLPSWRLGGRPQPWLQGGHPKAFRGPEPLSSCGRPAGWFGHVDGSHSKLPAPTFRKERAVNFSFESFSAL